MRNALCFAGVPRFIEDTWPNIHRNLIVPNGNPDIFVHAWASNESEVAKIRELYKPVELVYEPHRTFINPKLDMDRQLAKYGMPPRDGFVNVTYSMWYSIMQSHLLKERHRLTNGINYDRVARCRFDITYDSPICFDNSPSDAVWLYARGIPDMYADVFMVGPEKFANIFSTLFNSIDYVNAIRSKGDGIFCGETLLYEGLRLAGIPVSILPNCYAHRNHGDLRWL
jgi:hypothetical protein